VFHHKETETERIQKKSFYREDAKSAKKSRKSEGLKVKRIPVFLASLPLALFASSR